MSEKTAEKKPEKEARTEPIASGLEQILGGLDDAALEQLSAAYNAADPATKLGVSAGIAYGLGLSAMAAGERGMIELYFSMGLFLQDLAETYAGVSATNPWQGLENEIANYATLDAYDVASEPQLDTIPVAAEAMSWGTANPVGVQPLNMYDRAA